MRIEDYINKIYCGNCVDIMKEFSSSSIDLVITSPPYDNLRDYEGFLFNFENIANELYRVIKGGGVIVWIVGDATINGSETGTSFKQALYFKNIGLNIHDTMIYEKSGCPYPMKNRYYQSFEYMFILSKGKPKTVNLIKDKKNIYSGDKVARKGGFRQKDGKLIGNSAYRLDKERLIKDYGVRYNIWRFKTSSQRGDKIALKHPASFPENLVNDHIITWSKENDIIFDPMCGSGTTLKMAKLNKRKYIGIDISMKYCKIASERVDNVPIVEFKKKNKVSKVEEPKVDWKKVFDV